jgi:hypothetical protein
MHGLSTTIPIDTLQTGPCQDDPWLKIAWSWWWDVALSFIGLIFSGSVIYWEYAAGNPITYQSYSIIYSLGYHYNLASYFTTYWLTYYQVIDYVRDIITIKVVPYVGPLFDYNKNDLFYLANDVSLGRYQDALHDMANSTVIYNDGINIITSLK